MNGFREGGARLFRAVSAEVWLVQQRKEARGPLDRAHRRGRSRTGEMAQRGQGAPELGRVWYPPKMKMQQNKWSQADGERG